MSDRQRDLDRRVNERYLTAPDAQQAYRTDPVWHADIQRVRALFRATELAMEAEGIAEDVRDRVLHRLLYGHPHADSAKYAELDRKTAERLREAALAPVGWRRLGGEI